MTKWPQILAVKSLILMAKWILYYFTPSSLQISNASVIDDAVFECQVGPSPHNAPIRASGRLTVLRKSKTTWLNTWSKTFWLIQNILPLCNYPPNDILFFSSSPEQNRIGRLWNSDPTDREGERRSGTQVRRPRGKAQGQGRLVQAQHRLQTWWV